MKEPTLVVPMLPFRAPGLMALIVAMAACGDGETATSNSPVDHDGPAALEPIVEADALTVADTMGATDPLDPTGGVAIHWDDEGRLEDDEDDEIAVAEVRSQAVGGSQVALSRSTRFRGGIPFGTFHLPRTLYGKYSGSISNIKPRYLLSYLAAARRSGTRVMLSLSGSERHFQARNKAFSLEKWKARVNRYRGLNLTPYIKDGTIIGHYLMDEPHDPRNWGGRLVSRTTIEAMAKYSKARWPAMATIVRSPPQYLKGFRYRYLDAAWAQYHQRFGSPARWIVRNVSEAKAARLALVVGVNQLAGGARPGGLSGFHRSGHAMSASQLKAWGTAILNNSYPCAFLSWKFNQRYMARADIKISLTYLAAKARARASKSCRGAG